MKTREIIDAVTGAVNELALPAHHTFKYHRPLSLATGVGARVPALAVAPAIDRAPLLATDGTNAWCHKILVTWYAGQMQAMTMGQLDEQLAAATLDNVSLMVDLFATWDTQVEPLDFQAQSTLGEIHYGAIEGGIWAAEINLQVEHWSQD